MWIYRRYRIYDALAAPSALHYALLSIAINTYSQYMLCMYAASGLRTPTRAFSGSNMMEPRPNVMVRTDRRARKASRQTKPRQTPDALRQLVRLQLHEGAEQLDTVEDDHDTADAINPCESVHVDLATQPVEHKSQGVEPGEVGGCEACNETRVAARGKRGPECAQHDGSVDDGLRVQPCRHK